MKSSQQDFIEGPIFKTYFPHLHELQLGGTFTIFIKEHSADENRGIQPATTSFICSLFGPFLSATLQRSSNYGKHPFFHNYHLFLPHFMAATTKGNISIHLVPIHPDVMIEIVITFASIPQCLEWYNAIKKIEKIINDLSHVPNKVALPVKCIKYKMRKITQKNMEIVIQGLNSKIIFDDPEKGTDSRKSIPLNYKTSALIPYNHCDFLLEDYFVSFYIKNHSKPIKFIVFESKDMLYAFFTIIHVIIYQQILNHRKSSKPIYFFAKPIPQPNKDLVFSDIVFTSLNNHNFQSQVEYKCTADPYLFSKYPVVPSKASKDLQLLSFEHEIQRRLIIVKPPQTNGRAPIQRTSQSNFQHFSSSSFEDQMSLLRSNYPDNIPQYNLKPSSKLPFHIFSKFDSLILMKSSNEILKSFFFSIRDTTRDTTNL